MAYIIPSSRIFSTTNHKVVNNQINKISVNEYEINKPTKTILDFSWTPLSSKEFSFKFAWAKIDYVYYNEDWAFDRSDITSGSYTQNNVVGRNITFKIKSNTFIDLSKLDLNIKMRYRYGESKSGAALGRPALMQNDNLQNSETTSVSMTLKYNAPSQSQMLLPAYSSVPSINAIAQLQTSSPRSNSITVMVWIPSYYNPNYTSQTGRVDSVVFETFSVSMTAKEFETPQSYNRTYGSGEKVSTLNSNEFFQSYQGTADLDENEKVPYGTCYNGEDFIQMLSDKIIADYQNGKETATIRCSVDESLRIYDIGDEVIPMVYGEDGKDRPMSLYKDGTKKVFRVVGTKFIYDGAVWQELTLQEVTNG